MIPTLARLSIVTLGALLAADLARADPLALRLPSSGGVVAVGWKEVSAGYWENPHLGFGVDAMLPGEVGLALGTRGRTGQGMGLDFGIAGGPQIYFTSPGIDFGLMVSPWCDFALRGRGVLDVGLTLPGTVDISVFGATWAAPLLLEASGGWTFGTVRVGLWGNVGATYALSEWAPQGNAGLWLGIGKENRTH